MSWSIMQQYSPVAHFQGEVERQTEERGKRAEKHEKTEERKRMDIRVPILSFVSSLFLLWSKL